MESKLRRQQDELDKETSSAVDPNLIFQANPDLDTDPDPDPNPDPGF